MFVVLMIIISGVVPVLHEHVSAASGYSYKRTCFIKGDGDITSTFSVDYNGKTITGLCTHGGPMSEKSGKVKLTELSGTDSRVYLAYYYGYKNGYTTGANGCDLARAFHYATYGTAYHQTASKSKSMIKNAADYCKEKGIPPNFRAYFCNPVDGAQEFIAWSYNPDGKLKLIKSSDDPMAQKAGYTFENIEYKVYGKENEKSKCYGTLTCTEGGTTNTILLPPDGPAAKSYYVKESASNEFYDIDESWYAVDIEPGADKTLYVKDRPEYGSLTFRKVLDDSSSKKDATVEGFCFTLKNTENAGVCYTAYSDENGNVSFDNILKGSYILKEELTAAQEKEGYVPVTGSMSIIIHEGNNKISAVKNEYVNTKVPVKPGLKIKKSVDDTGTVENWEFKVECHENGYSETFRTDKNGEIWLDDLEAGEYIITEVMTQNQAVRYSEPEPQKVTLVEDSEELAIVRFENKAIMHSVKIKKTSADGGICGIEFTLTGKQYIGTEYERTIDSMKGTTDSKGYLDLGKLPPGRYVAEETGFSEYYINNYKLEGYVNPAIEFTVTKEGVYCSGTKLQNSVIEFENIPYQVKLMKNEILTDGTETDNPVPGATYDLYKITGDNEEYINSYVTDDNGEFSLYGVTKGKYRFRETAAPPGYEIRMEKTETDGEEVLKPQAIDFTVGEDDNSTVVVRDSNRQKYGTVFLTKYDDIEQPVEDAEITLFTDAACTEAAEDINGNELTGITDRKGQYVFEKIPWGTFYIKETAAPRGYVVSDDVIKIKIGKDSETGMISVDEEIIIVNSRKTGGITVTKIDENNNIIKSPAVFNLYTDDGILVAADLTTGNDNNGDGAADGEGMICLENLPWGSYYFLETDAPDGYDISEEKHRFTVNTYSAGTMQMKKISNHVIETQVVATKKILAEDIWTEHGTPTFTFKLEGETVAGLNKTYHRSVTFSEKYVKEHTDPEGFVSASATFDNIPAGNYFLSEKDVSRYGFGGIEENSLVNGKAVDQTVEFELSGDNRYAAATFLNEKYEWQDYSSSEITDNMIKKQRTYSGLTAEYKDEALEGNKEIDDIGKYLDVYAIYDDGKERKLDTSEYTALDIDGKEFCKTPKAAGVYTLFITHEEDGISNTATAQVKISAAEKYEVKFVTNGGTAMENLTVYKYDPLNQATTDTAKYIPYREYYTFASWYADEELTVPFGLDEPVLSDMTLYAAYNPNTFIVHYNGNGATEGFTASSIHTCNIDQKLTGNGYMKKGYVFNGWNTESDGSGTDFCDEQNVCNLTDVNNGNVILYAQWEPVTYTVKYVTETGSGSTTESNHTYDESKELSASGFTRALSVFGGWNTKADGSGISYPDKASVKNLTDKNGDTVTLYAMWKIPEDAVYTTADGTVLKEGEYYPYETVQGDKFEYRDYIYSYQQYYNPETGSWANRTISPTIGWNARVKTTDQKTYCDVEKEINGRLLEGLLWTYRGCASMKTAPDIPEDVNNLYGTYIDCTSLISPPEVSPVAHDMRYTFRGCTNLKTAPAIPDSVKTMAGCFQGCKLIVSAPVIPSSVTNLSHTFYDCENLTGDVVINCNPTKYDYCFAETVKPIRITGSCNSATKAALKASNASWGNVTY